VEIATEDRTIVRPRRPLAALAVAALAAPLAACGTDAEAGTTVALVIGYQSKTINTVNAGTLLRSQGYLEKRLAELGKKNGKTYTVKWQDYDTGAPITAQMLAGKIDIGSMGDYPLLINGSKTGTIKDARTEYIATTGYNAKGALNSVVVKNDSPISSLAELKGKKVSASVGSAGHGLLVRALKEAGVDPTEVSVQNQLPAVGASALQAGQVDAFAQFVAWPGLVVFKGQGRLLYDGGDVGLPTFHGVVARRAYTDEHPEVTDAFLKSVIDATNYIHAEPLKAAESVAKATGLPAEVVYLYNGANGISTFDTTIKPLQKDALAEDVPFLKSIGVLKTLDLKAFVNDTYIKKAYGDGYAKALESTTNPAAIKGDPATASEAWFAGEEKTQAAADPAALLKLIKENGGKKVRAAYVPTINGTRWFADKAVWISDGGKLLAASTPTGAAKYVAEHSGATQITYEAALAAA
jgi:NitT/TauT family transport system substrate-binding protein